MAVKRKSGRSRKRRGFIGGFFSFVLICAAVFAAITIFFKVDEITIEGESRYSQEEIIAASGVEIGEHMMLINQSEIAHNIQSKLNYIGEVSVARSFPDILVIKVNDSTAAAYIKLSGSYWLIDINCKILEKVDPDALGSAAEVTGISPVSPAEGYIMTAKGNESNKVAYLSEILTYATSQGIMGGIISIDMSNVTNVQFNYMDRFDVKLGANSEVEYKFQMLTGVIEELGENVQGVIDLSNTSKISFYPN